MSWSVSLIGKPDAICEELGAYSATLSGLSKHEFDAAVPHLVALVQQNIGLYGSLRLEANGHATLDNAGKVATGTCNVTLRQEVAKVV